MLVDGQRVPAGPALQQAGIAPLTLGPKEGLALINGTQTSTALALHGRTLLWDASPLEGAVEEDGKLSVPCMRFVSHRHVQYALDCYFERTRRLVHEMEGMVQEERRRHVVREYDAP